MPNFDKDKSKINIDRYIDLIRSQNSTWNRIPAHYYSEYNVKRGLRNSDGTGVLAGLTSIGEVHGYVIDEGNKSPVEGKLRYRGIDIEDIVAHCMAEHRYGLKKLRFYCFLDFCLQESCSIRLPLSSRICEICRSSLRRI